MNLVPITTLFAKLGRPRWRRDILVKVTVSSRRSYKPAIRYPRYWAACVSNGGDDARLRSCDFRRGCLRLVPVLEIQPDLRGPAEIPLETRRCFCGYRAFPLHDFVNEARRYINCFRDPVLRKPERLHKILRQNLARMHLRKVLGTGWRNLAFPRCFHSVVTVNGADRILWEKTGRLLLNAPGRCQTSSVMPRLERIDHVHVYADDRTEAEEWYRRVLGLERVPELAHWATADGPLFLGNAEGSVALALFEKSAQPTRATVAFRASGEEFLAWRAHLRACRVSFRLEDHELSWSLYSAGPDSAPFEITSYDYIWLKQHL